MSDNLNDLIAGYVPPTSEQVSKAMWEHTISIAEATRRVAQRQLGLLRTQAEIIGEQMIAEQAKIDRADYDINTARQALEPL